MTWLPRRSGAVRRGAYALVMAVSFGLAVAPSVSQRSTAEDATPAPATPSACPRPLVVAPGAGRPVNADPPDAARALSQGSWAPMARSPFGSEYEPAAWTGTRLVAVDNDSGRTATYRPDRDRWREAATAPRPTEPTAPSAWTGAELVIVELAEDGSRLDGLAYHAGTDRWRTLATHSLEPDGRSEHALSDAMWSGSHVVVVDGLGLLAAYDPLDDCWRELGEVPGEPWAWHLYPADGALLVESRRWDASVEIRAFDPAAGTWSEPSIGPLDRDSAEDGGHPIDGRLVYVSWRRDAAVGGATNARFDPATMTWSTFEHACATAASGTVEAGVLLIANDGRRALDGRSLDCLDLPAPPRALNGTERTVWTGTELIAWSGICSLPQPPRRGGLILRPGAPE